MSSEELTALRSSIGRLQRSRARTDAVRLDRIVSLIKAAMPHLAAAEVELELDTLGDSTLWQLAAIAGSRQRPVPRTRAKRKANRQGALQGVLPPAAQTVSAAPSVATHSETPKPSTLEPVAMGDSEGRGIVLQRYDDADDDGYVSLSDSDDSEAGELDVLSDADFVRLCDDGDGDDDDDAQVPRARSLGARVERTPSAAALWILPIDSRSLSCTRVSRLRLACRRGTSECHDLRGMSASNAGASSRLESYCSNRNEPRSSTVDKSRCVNLSTLLSIRTCL